MHIHPACAPWRLCPASAGGYPGTSPELQKDRRSHLWYSLLCCRVNAPLRLLRPEKRGRLKSDSDRPRAADFPALVRRRGRRSGLWLAERGVGFSNVSGLRTGSLRIADWSFIGRTEGL